MKAIVGQRSTAVPPKPPMVMFGGTLGVLALALGVGVLAAFAFDLHSHQCACGNKWRHLGAFAVGDVAAHRCSRCGTVQWWKAGAYDTDGAYHMHTPPAQPAPTTIAISEPWG